MKNTTQLLTQAIAIVLIVATLVFKDSIPYFAEAVLSLWILLTIYFGFVKTPNLSEKRLYLTTQNDSASLHTNLILGLFMIVGGGFYYYYTKEFRLILWLLMVQSTFLIFLNFYKKTETKGLSILVKDQRLQYSIGKEHKKIILQEIKNVQIQKDRIIISREEQKKNYLSYLELNPDEVKQAASFFRSILNQKAVTSEH